MYKKFSKSVFTIVDNVGDYEKNPIFKGWIAVDNIVDTVDYFVNWFLLT